MKGQKGDTRIALLAPLPGPYYIAAWNELNRLTGENLAVRFLSLSNTRRHWRVPVEEMRFDWAALAKGSQRPLLKWLLDQCRAGAAMLAFLVRWQPKAVICGGYDSLAAWTAFLWCKLFQRRLALCLDSHASDARPRSRLRLYLKQVFVSRCDSVAVLGNAARAYAIQLGAKESGIVRAPYGGDTALFAREAEKVDATAEKRLRGWPAKLILYSGRLAPEKGIFALLEAFKRVSETLLDAGLLLVGDGPLRRDAERYCQENSLDRAFFCGPQPYERMPYFYALADVLVLPSLSEPYGYVVIEAFACGVPAIVSRIAGAAADLIVEGQTGYCITPGDAEELALKIAIVLQDGELRKRMSENCRPKAREFGPQECAAGLLAAAGKPGFSGSRPTSAPRLAH